MLRFTQNTTIAVSGVTGAGKTRLVFKLLKNAEHLFSGPAPYNILYAYGIHQPLFEEMEHVIPDILFAQGLPSEQMLTKFISAKNTSILVLDDLMSEVTSSKEAEKLFSQGAHHRGLNLIYINQNLYYKAPRTRSIALNTQYQFLLKNPRDVTQIRHFARQVFPDNPSSMLKAYADCMKVRYGYLLVDLSPHSDDVYRMRSRIFPGEDTVIYHY